MATPLTVRLSPKFPAESINYGLDFRRELRGATITGHRVVAPAGLTVEDSSVTGSVVTARLKGGTLGQTYAVLYEATTSDGQVAQAYALIPVVAPPA